MKFHSLCLTAFAALSIAFAGCSNDDNVVLPDGGEADGPQFTLSLGLAARSADMSRASVGSDLGLPGERQVKNAMILIYDRPLNTSGDDGKILKVVYLENFPASSTGQSIDAKYVDPNPSYYPLTDVLNYVKVGKVSVSDHYDYPTFSIDESKNPLEVGRRYYATAVCNFGDMTSTFEGMSLKEFRDYVYKGELFTASGNIKEYTDFRMSGINETSFIWQRDASVPVDLGYFLVQRLAARLDVMLGDDGVDFTWPWAAPYDLKLNIYVEGDDGKLTKTDNVFYLTDLKILNNVDCNATGSYLIERSSPFSPSYRDNAGNPAVPVYFDNEGWPANGQANATKYVYSPSSKTVRAEYSLVPAGSTLFDLINAGNFNSQGFTGNKNSSSIVGYLNENTNSSRYTVLRIVGQTNVTTSEIFPNVSRGVPEGENYYIVTGEIPIRHSLNTESDRMRYATVRNTIYRVRLKIVAREGKIYFRYYYAEPGEDNQKEFDSTPFTPNVGENTGSGTVTPND